MTDRAFLVSPSCACGCGAKIEGVGQFMIIGERSYIYGHHPQQARQSAAVPEALSPQQAEGWVLLAAAECDKFAEKASTQALDARERAHDKDQRWYMACQEMAKGMAAHFRALSAAPSAPTGERAAGLTGEERAVLQYARGALQYAYGNVSSATADKVKQAIIPELDRLTGGAK